MKWLIGTFVVVVATIGIASVSSAGEKENHNAGQISDAQLFELGLAGMQRVDDREGRKIRGTGFAFVFSSSFATGGSLDTNLNFGTGFQSVSTSSTGTGTFAFSGAFAFAGN